MALSLDTLSPLDPNNMEPVNCDGLKVNLFSDISPEISVSDEKLATFLRIRPLESLSIDESPYKVINSNLLCVDLEENASINNGNRKPSGKKRKFFNFTEIFDDSVSQKTIFSKCCLPLVNDVLNGTNALLFCFGTTSSGKSYTMRGPPDDPTSDPGLIPLSLKRIFCSRKFVDEPLIGRSKFCDINLLNQEQQDVERQFKESILASSCCRNVSAFTAIDNSSQFNEDGYQYICYLSYFEIYNGLVFDLLVPSSGGRGTALSLFPDDKQRYFVKDLKSVMVSTLTEALQIYSFGWTNLQRNIQETGLNKNSSRSHSFLCVTLIKFKEDDGRLLESQVSHLTLGDLAGSERQNKTHSEGLRVKEGGNINVSLMHLKECFNQTKLSQKNPNRNFVIPFRNSSLTKFFQPYLTGTGRVWMIDNINPSQNLLNETCGSLDLGETASHISVNSTYQLNLETILEQVRQEMAQPAIVTGDQEVQTDQQMVPIEELEMLKRYKDMEIEKLKVQWEEETKSKLHQLRQEFAQRLVVTEEREAQTEQNMVPIEEIDLVRRSKEMEINELKALQENEMISNLKKLRQEVTQSFIVTRDQEVQTDQQMVLIDEFKLIKASHATYLKETFKKVAEKIERYEKQLIELEEKLIKKENGVIVPKAVDYQSIEDYQPENLMEMYINDFSTIASPSTEIANEYMRMSCPVNATKKSVKKSAKRQPRKSTKWAVIPEPEYEKENDVEEDEYASLLSSQKKVENSNEEESALKIPVKRKRLTVNDTQLITISDYDEEKRESNVKQRRKKSSTPYRRPFKSSNDVSMYLTQFRQLSPKESPYFKGIYKLRAKRSSIMPNLSNCC